MRKGEFILKVDSVSEHVSNCIDIKCRLTEPLFNEEKLTDYREHKKEREILEIPLVKRFTHNIPPV